MNIAFKIEPSAEKNIDLHLIIEVGDEDISFLIFSKTPFKIQGFCSLSFEKNIDPSVYKSDARTFLEDAFFLKNDNFSSTTISYNFSTSTLVPLQYFVEDEKQEILETLFVPDKRRICFQEVCSGQNIKNIYSVPAEIHNLFREKYPSCKFTHSTCYQLANNKDAELYCIIYQLCIKIIFFKEEQLQIVQYFTYTTPTDICYQLLNVAERFDVAASACHLTLSGMVDVSSSLYKELYKYFLKINVAESPDVTISDLLEELPTHYYHHLTALAHAHN